MKIPLAACAALFAASSAAAEGLPAALSGGKPNLDARLRYENVEQENLAAEAQAATLRLRLGYTTDQWNKLDLAAEYEGVFPVGDEDYNDTVNGSVAFPMVADPQGSELNQAWLRYAGIPGTQLKLGRQRVVFDNARFIGNVGWRQNEQTYDSVLFSNALLPKTTINVAYLDNVNAFRSFTVAGAATDDIELAGTVLNVNVAAFEALNVTAYAYLLDFKEAVAVAARQDTQTVGSRLTGVLPLDAVTLNFVLEFADQSAFADAPATVDASYGLAELGAASGPVNGKLGYEIRGGDGSYALQTPLATAHAFNGWADQFIAAPATGLRDRYAQIGGMVEKVSLLARYHRFDADEGRARYGSEVDFMVSRPVVENFVLILKYADYRARSFAADTAKLWAVAEYKF